MSIEGIALEHFIEVPQTNINSTTPSPQRHSVFHFFKSDDSKQYSATTTENSKHLISFLKEKKVMTTSLSKIWENTYGCAEQYICATGYSKEVVDGLNDVDKR